MTPYITSHIILELNTRSLQMFFLLWLVTFDFVTFNQNEDDSGSFRGKQSSFYEYTHASCQFIIPSSLFYQGNGLCCKFATSHKKCHQARTTDTQWRHKSEKSENLGRCGRQNMLRPYLKTWDLDWIFGRAVKASSSLGVRSLCLV